MWSSRSTALKGQAREAGFLWLIVTIGKELDINEGREYVVSKPRHIGKRLGVTLYTNVRKHLTSWLELDDEGGVYIDERLVICG